MRGNKGILTTRRKKEDKTAEPVQNIPFNLEFVSDSNLGVTYTTPGGSRDTIITFPAADVPAGQEVQIALAWDTNINNNNQLRVYLKGKTYTRTGLDLWTGNTYPKFGIYRAETVGWDENVYRFTISDQSLNDVKAAGGL